MKRYNNSEKGKERNKAFDKSEKRKLWQKEYLQRPETKERMRINALKYSRTEHGKQKRDVWASSPVGILSRHEAKKKYRKSERGIQTESTYNSLHKENRNGYAMASHRKLRLKLMELMGNRCNSQFCLVPGGCTDTRCLHIDHIHGNGSTERKRFGGSAANEWRYYISHPEELDNNLQILCSNCNWIKVDEKHERAYNNRINI